MAAANSTNRRKRHNVGLNCPPQEQVMTCTICLDTFTNPKFLPCFHTFCKACLHQQIERTCQGQRFPCPLCRMSIKLPSGGVDAFQTNFYIQEILMLLNKSNDKQLAVRQKKELSEVPKIKAVEFKEEDEVEWLEQEHDWEEEEALCDLLCPEHAADKEWFTSYCKRCQVPICSRCMCYDHYGHESETLAVALDEARRALYTLNFRVHRYQNITQEVVKDRQRYMDSYIAQLSVVADEVSSNAEEIKMMVNMRTQTLLQLMENLKVTEVDRAKDHEDEMTSYLQDLGEVKDQICYLMGNANVVDTLTCFRMLKDKGEQVMKKMPRNIDKYSVVYDKAFVRGIEKPIEEAMGYLHTEKDPRFDTLIEPDIPDYVNDNSEDEGSQITSHPRVTPSFLGNLNGDSFKGRNQNGNIRMIVPVPTVGAWIGYDYGIPYMDLVTTNGLIVQTIKVSAPVTDAAILDGEQLILARNKPNRLSVWQTMTHQIIKHVTHIPLSIQPFGIAVRNSKEVFVCGKNESSDESGVFIVNLVNNTLTCMFKDGVINPLKSPNKIACGSTDDGDVVCVSDSKRRLVYFFSITGQCLSVFPNMRCSSSPEGICIDNKGNLIMADKGNGSVIVLTTKGEFVKELVGGGTGLSGPRAVAVDDQGRLWVGDSLGNVSVFYNQSLY